MPTRPCVGMWTEPSKSRSRPARMRISVDLPQPDGPISAPVSPSSSANERLAMTGALCPEAVRKDFFATRASSRARSPTGDVTFKGLHRKRFDDEHDRREGQRISEQQGDVEQLESCIDFEPDAVRPAHEFNHQHDLPDKRQASTGRGGEIGRKLRRHDMGEPLQWRKAEHARHLVEPRVKRAHALAYGD